MAEWNDNYSSLDWDEASDTDSTTSESMSTPQSSSKKDIVLNIPVSIESNTRASNKQDRPRRPELENRKIDDRASNHWADHSSVPVSTGVFPTRNHSKVRRDHVDQRSSSRKRLQNECTRSTKHKLSYNDNRVLHSFQESRHNHQNCVGTRFDSLNRNDSHSASFPLIGQEKTTNQLSVFNRCLFKRGSQNISSNNPYSSLFEGIRSNNNKTINGSISSVVKSAQNISINNIRPGSLTRLGEGQSPKSEEKSVTEKSDICITISNEVNKILDTSKDGDRDRSRSPSIHDNKLSETTRRESENFRSICLNIPNCDTQSDKILLSVTDTHSVEEDLSQSTKSQTDMLKNTSKKKIVVVFADNEEAFNADPENIKIEQSIENVSQNLKSRNNPINLVISEKPGDHANTENVRRSFTQARTRDQTRQKLNENGGSIHITGRLGSKIDNSTATNITALEVVINQPNSQKISSSTPQKPKCKISINSKGREPTNACSENLPFMPVLITIADNQEIYSNYTSKNVKLPKSVWTCS